MKSLISGVLLLSASFMADAQAPKQYPIPVCSGPVACGQMWTRAYKYVQMASGMKVLSSSELTIQTYPANTLGRMTGTVQKFPISESDYEIRLTLECRRGENCGDLAAQGVNLFNMSVAGPGR